VLNAPKEEDQLKPVSSGAEADSEPSEDEESTKEDINATETGKKFGEIKIGDLKKSMAFIIDHPEVVSERNQDGLLVLAFSAQMEDHDALSKQYVHQALLIQYVRQVGRSGTETFFKGYSSSPYTSNIASRTATTKPTPSSTTT
jgi:cell division cycle protein 37